MLDIQKDNTIYNINNILTLITSSLTILQWNQLNTSDVVGNFKDNMLKEIVLLSKNMLDMFMNLEYIKKAHDSNATNLGGKIQNNNFQLLTNIDNFNS